MAEDPRSFEQGDSAEVKGLRGRWRSRRFRRFAVLGAALVAASALMISFALATNLGGFEIDADHTTASDALYSGNDSGDDWADGGTGAGVFAAGTGTDCYGSHIDQVLAPSTVICDGNSDTKFKNIEPEQNIVSPSGKTPDDVWPVKPGNVRPKNDFSHAYVHAATVDSPCDDDGPVGPTGELADDTVLHLGGHVGDNEGSHFWGFEFNKTAPSNFNLLKEADGDSFNLDFNRSLDDFLVSFTVPGSAADPVAVEVFRVTGFQPDNDANFTLAAALPGCPAGQPQGLTLLTTNDEHDVEAPPWNVPVCDPTADNGSNSCRLANGTTNNEDLLAPRDFAEASIDLTAFNINPCVSNVIFTSRSSHVLEGADIQDVGGGDFNLCGKKTGIKYEDRNADGDRDTGEPALGGWPINLYQDADGDGILEDADDGNGANGFTTFRTTTTSSVAGATLGTYEFTTLPNGEYIVCEADKPPSSTDTWFESQPNSGTAPADLADCSAGTGLADAGYEFTMSGTDHTGNDFGNYRNATVSGTKYKDTDADGLVSDQAQADGLSGWTINLYKDRVGAGTQGTLEDADDGTADGVFTPVLGKTAVTSNVPATLGDYSITGIAPGTYILCEVIATKAGWKETFPNGNTSNRASCPPPTTDPPGLAAVGHAITLTSNQSAVDLDFGNAPLSKIQVTFLPQATLPGGGAATEATSISCVDSSSASVGSVSNPDGLGAPPTSLNPETLLSNNVDTRQSSVVCTITYRDP